MRNFSVPGDKRKNEDGLRDGDISYHRTFSVQYDENSAPNKESRLNHRRKNRRNKRKNGYYQ